MNGRGRASSSIRGFEAPSRVTTKLPLRGFSLLISILVNPASFKIFSTLELLVLNTPQDLQASIVTFFDLLYEPLDAADEVDSVFFATLPSVLVTTGFFAVAAAFLEETFVMALN